MNRYFILIFILIMLIIGCKYKDGPLFSLQSRESRVEGDYYIESVTENDIDAMNSVAPLNIDELHFRNEQSDYAGLQFYVTFTDTSEYPEGSWNIPKIYNNDTLFIQNLGCISSSATPPPFAPIPGFMSDGTCTYIPLWKILKLSQNRMWLSMSFNGNKYEVHLKEK